MDGMFDVGHKSDTFRTAKAQAILKVKPETISLIKEGKSPKGDVFETAVRDSISIPVFQTVSDSATIFIEFSFKDTLIVTLSIGIG